MRLISVNEAALRLGLSPLTIRRLIRRGELTAVRPTKRAVRVREEDVEALIRMGYRPQEGAGRLSDRQRQPWGFDLELPDEGLDLDATVDQIEARFLVKALERTKGVQIRAAELLRLTFRQFRYKVQKHGLRRAKSLEEDTDGSQSKLRSSDNMASA